MRYVAGVLLGVLAFPLVAGAASYQFSPASGSRALGSTFTVHIEASATDQAINAVSGTVSFPASRLSVVGISKAGSVVNMWVQEPSYSNAAGTISFEGIVLNPGYRGPGGRILSVTFRTLAPGSVPVSFASGAILANDGQGTNVNIGLARATYSVSGEGEVAPPAPKPTGQAPVAFRSSIRSVTHPEEGTWSSSPRASFEWDVPPGVVGTLYDLDRQPASVPVTEIAGRADSTEVRLDSWPGDGAYYFHLRFRTESGLTQVVHRKISVDRTAPADLTVKEVKSDDPTDPAIVLELSAADELSGVAGYSYLGEGGTWQPLNVSPDGLTELRAWQPGEQTLRVRATDVAGNSREVEVPLYRKPLASPDITSFTDRVNQLVGSAHNLFRTDEPGTVGGTADLDRKVLVRFALADVVRHEVQAQVDGNGRWRATYPELEPGDWQVFAVAEDSRGARSFPSDPVTVTSYGPWSRIVPVIGGIALLVIGAIAAWLALVAEYQFMGRVQLLLGRIFRRRQ